MQIWMIMNWIFNMATTAIPWCLTTSAGWTTSIEFEKWLAPAAAPLACPQFFYWLSVDTKATSRILEKKAKNRGTTTHTWYNLDYCHARPNTRTTVEPRKNNNKLSFVGVRCSSCKQIQKQKPRRSWRGERNKGLEDLKIGHFFLIPYFHSHIIC